MYARDRNGVLLFNGEKVDRIIVDELLLLRMFKWLRIGGHPNLGVKSPWWAKYIELDHPEELRMDLPSAVEIAMYWELISCIISLDKYDQQMIFARLGSGKRLNYRKCGKELKVSHELFRQRLQTVINKIQKTFDKITKITL